MGPFSHTIASIRTTIFLESNENRWGLQKWANHPIEHDSHVTVQFPDSTTPNGVEEWALIG